VCAFMCHPTKPPGSTFKAIMFQEWGLDNNHILLNSSLKLNWWKTIIHFPRNFILWCSTISGTFSPQLVTFTLDLIWQVLAERHRQCTTTLCSRCLYKLENNNMIYLLYPNFTDQQGTNIMVHWIRSNRVLFYSPSSAPYTVMLLL